MRAIVVYLACLLSLVSVAHADSASGLQPGPSAVLENLLPATPDGWTRAKTALFGKDGNFPPAPFANAHYSIGKFSADVTLMYGDQNKNYQAIRGMLIDENLAKKSGVQLVKLNGLPFLSASGSNGVHEFATAVGQSITVVVISSDEEGGILLINLINFNDLTKLDP